MNEQEMKKFLGLEYFPNLHIYTNIIGADDTRWTYIELPSNNNEEKGSDKEEVWLPNYEIYGNVEEKKNKLTYDIINTIAASSSDGGYTPISEISTHVFIDNVNVLNRVGILTLKNKQYGLSRLNEKLFKLIKVGKPEVVKS